MNYKNTLQRSSVRYIVFREDKTWYAVGLEFNIVETGDDPREVLLSLLEAIQGYAKSAEKIKARPHILKQTCDAEYEKLWKRLQEKKERPVEDAPVVYTFGQRELVAL